MVVDGGLDQRLDLGIELFQGTHRAYEVLERSGADPIHGLILLTRESFGRPNARVMAIGPPWSPILA